jgi:hypothetical protein
LHNFREVVLRSAAKNWFETIFCIDGSVDAIHYCSKALTFAPELHCLDITSVSEQKLQSILGRQFDMVTIMFGTITHFNDIEQLEVLRRASCLLSDNGRHTALPDVMRYNKSILSRFASLS